ncbi:hypothetical protein [Burkholderia ubonensis]|uniref:hypothetical protein n=1 Tax=Burkholderia ubonensis TaxID=101571 RepID=UPI000B06E0AD|nr:hypothetical protein [Burkholderia ubonensis]
MSTHIHTLSDHGISLFANYIDRCRSGSTENPPTHLLSDSEFSSITDFNASISPRTFDNLFEYGKYLSETLSKIDRHTISLQYGLWNWLTLYYIDFLAPADANGNRSFRRPEYYVLLPGSAYTRHYKHFTRIAWLAYTVHGQSAKLLLTQTKGGLTNDYRELLTGTQDRVENRTIISTAYKLYFDEMTGKPRARSSGKNGLGSIHRFSTILGQLQRTFDLQSMSPDQLITLLPKEFDRYKVLAETSTNT